MSRVDRSHEDDFDRRWSAAGALDEERRVIAEDVRSAEALEEARRSTTPLSLQMGWRRVRAEIGARQKSRSRDLMIAIGLGAGALASAVLLVVAISGSGTSPDAVRAPSGAELAGQGESAKPAEAPQIAAAIKSPPPTPAPAPAQSVEREAPPPPKRVARARTSASPQLPEIPGVRIDLAAGKMHIDASGVFVLDSGTVKVELERPPGTPPLRFRAGDLAVEVLATTFALRVDGAHGMVRVFDGNAVTKRSREAPIRVDQAAGVTPPAQHWDRKELAALERWGESKKPHAGRPIVAGVEPDKAALAPGGPHRMLSSLSSTTRKLESAYATPPIVQEAPRYDDRARAELAAYGAALKLLRSGRAKEAAQRFGEYLDRYPEGLLEQEAELSRLEALRAAESWDELARAGERWLSAHPRDPRAPEVQALIQEIVR